MELTGTKAIYNHTFSKNFGKEGTGMQSEYDKIRFLEPVISDEIMRVTSKLGTSLSGLECSSKTASSIEDKLLRAKANAERLNQPFSPTEYLNQMKDVVRYTEICEHKNIITVAKDTIKELENAGYILSGSKNYYKNPYPTTQYMGIHLNFISPYGREIELQVHSRESFAVKQKGHEIYEKIRAVSTVPKDKNILKEEIVKIQQGISKPENYQSFDDYEMSLIQKEKIKKEKEKNVVIKIIKKQNNKVKSTAYEIIYTHEKKLRGFENIQSDGSVYVYREKDQKAYGISLTKEGAKTAERSLNSLNLSLETALAFGNELEIAHDFWVRTEELNMGKESSVMDVFKDSLRKVVVQNENINEVQNNKEVEIR